MYRTRFLQIQIFIFSVFRSKRFSCTLAFVVFPDALVCGRKQEEENYLRTFAPLQTNFIKLITLSPKLTIVFQQLLEWSEIFCQLLAEFFCTFRQHVTIYVYSNSITLSLLYYNLDIHFLSYFLYVLYLMKLFNML